MTLIGLFVAIVIIIVIFYVLDKSTGGVEQPWRGLLYLVIGLLIVLVLLRSLGVVGGPRLW